MVMISNYDRNTFQIAADKNDMIKKSCVFIRLQALDTFYFQTIQLITMSFRQNL